MSSRLSPEEWARSEGLEGGNPSGLRRKLSIRPPRGPELVEAMALSSRTAALHAVAPLPRLGLPSLPSYGSRRVNVRAKVEPSEKSVEIMRKFSEQYARKSETYFCMDKGVTSVVIKGLADHKAMLGAPLCPCRHYDDKAAEVAQGFWNCPCVPMRERKECHCMLFLNPDNDFAGKEQSITLEEIKEAISQI
ncbi:hypothetical protein OPV22_034254 [Ensete ventricosum]|uniref:Ferredoxin-thioredoxin reductase catalytic chain, chloroplastic n=1 Tax=Ensete ventricosum TaxID=4639 RepID=A0AAV8Q3X0_ENSVE|nr:hypothetical protein OPV22_034254 [Ensete ventricosum]